MHDIAQENKRLSEPGCSILEVEHLRHELKDEQKDKRSLRNAKARLLHLAQRVHNLKQRQADLTMKYRTMVSDRNALYDTFEHTVQTIYKKGECTNLIL
ncbi:Sporangia Induced Dynein Regulatory Complex Protein [Phytophthora cinnamomi]|uniref:Sporangia Induced Dynein Regulatory Complex Protein n=1 Tax=Phytophthora cinnamomi TaxID=4785 RepID=UPI0035598B0B|nr:Sporangia Induced Dynein Regulatory Complex Protein [Phytophthora cinnamomi]